MMDGQLDNPGPLRRYRVRDFGWVLAGALPGMALTDLGAQLIKVETRQRLDYMRMSRLIVGTQRDPEQNPMFHNVNRSKLSIRLNTSHSEAVELARRLVSQCDVVSVQRRISSPILRAASCNLRSGVYYKSNSRRHNINI